MALNIKNPRVHELAREAARRTGTTQTSALEAALEAYLAGLDDASSSTEDARADRLSKARTIVADIQAGLGDEARAALRSDVDALYDADGLPA